MSQPYRADIDGLRAVAVTAVIAFHAFPKQVPSGFVGVDIFFVISGFLISGILLDAIARGSMSIGEFYVRRVRRIFPALVLVMGVYLVAGWFVMPPVQYEHMGKHAFFGSAFVANLSLWREGGYFDTPVELKPLLHLWSLGVEEQFYLFWPIALWLMARRRWNLAVGTAVIALASFALNVYEAPRHPNATFYFPGTRFWEILMGAWLAAASRRTGGIPWPAWCTANVRAWSGVALLASALVFVTNQGVFPGWWAALPTTGAALLIAAGPHAWPNRVVLSNRAIVFVGLISYPLYLWHWPMLQVSLLPWRAFASPWAGVIGAFVAAWLTYQWWERPLRQSLPARSAVIGLVGAAIVIGAVGATVWARTGFPSRLSPTMQALLKPVSSDAAWRYRSCFLDMDKQTPAELAPACIETSPSDAPLVAIWGDSHGAELYAALASLQRAQRFRLAQLTATMCPPLINEAAAGPRCTVMRADMSKRVADLKPRTVVLASAWFRDAPGLEQKLSETIAFLRASGVIDIIIVGPPPKWIPTLPIALFHELRATGAIPNVLPASADRLADSRQLETRLRAIAAAGNVRYASPLDLLCDARGCLTRVSEALPEGLVATDGEHMSTAAATYFAERALGPLLPGAGR